jgi:hypothetical protein
MRNIYLLLFAAPLVGSTRLSRSLWGAIPRGGAGFGNEKKNFVLTEWLVPKEHGKADRNMKLHAPFTFEDSKGRIWTAPKDFVVDGATIPKALWLAFGSPYVNDFRRASVIHDYYCNKEIRKEKKSYYIDKKRNNKRFLARDQDVDQMFKEAMLCDGVPKWKVPLIAAPCHACNRWKTPKDNEV